MIYPIRYFGDPVLRQVARPVARFDDRLEKLVADMFETMFDANGIGLAAPQIGVRSQVFVAVEIDPSFADADDPTDGVEGAAPVVAEPDDAGDGAVTQPSPPARVSPPDEPRGARDPRALDELARARGVTAKHVLVNPKMLTEKGTQHGPDGCLSLPGLYVDAVERFDHVRLSYQDLQGETHEIEAEGRFAHVLQHEFDHLHGVLFFDRLPAAERHAFLEANRHELADMQRHAKALLKELKRAPLHASVG